MEIPDVTVYVLYDFDYQTKDGRRIEIKTGERLFLIKKTNNDWWQVIRSSERRPFYVPASYVEEVHKSSSGSYKHENKKQNFPKPRTSLSSSPSEITSQQKSIKCITGETFLDTASNLPSYRNRSFSLEDKRVIHNSSDKYSIDSVGNSTLSSSGYESLCEAVSISDSNNTVIPLNRLQQEEVDYVNLRQDGDGFVVDETSNSETAQTQLKAADGNNTGSNCDDKAVLSGITADNVNTQGAITGRLNSTKLEIVPSVTGGCYSNIIMCSDNSRKSGGFNGNSDLPLSSSLEELNEQIKVKTDKLRNVSNTGNGNSVICITDSGTIRQHHYDDSVNNHIIKGKSEAVSCESSCVNSIKKHSDIVSDVADRVKILNNKSEDSDTSSCKSDVDYKKLQYVGSFKTKQERQKWAKQHFEQCGLRNTVEAEKNKTEQSEQLDNICTLDMVNVENTDKIGGSSTMVGKVSTAVVIEKARKVEESMQQMEAVQRKDIMEINKNKTSSRHSLDSIAEDEWTDNKTKDEIKPLFGKSHQQQGSSDKGSLESLLDIDRNSGRKISGGNTSDSLVPTDGEDLYMDNSDSETDSIVLGHSRLRSDAVDNREYKQKVLLMRNRRVDNKGRQYPMQAPPSPTTTQAPSRMLFNGWNEYLTEDNRKFFYNLETKEKSWKPPRRRYNSNSEKQANSGSIGNIYSDSSSPLAETDEILTNFQLPAGWRTQLDEDTGLPCYINIVTGAKWFSSSDSEGRLYFFEVNSDESSWTLPITTPQIVNENTVNDGVPTDVIQTLPVVVPQSERNVNSRPAKAKSMIITDRREELAPLAPTVPRNWPQLWDGHMCVLKEGPLNRTKITENGKRLRKNWASTYVVLTELFLLFFKDSKTFTAMKSGGGRPELCVDLNGAVIDRGDKKSSRKNVYMISTVLELQVLIQCDCQSEAEQWLTAIELAIHNLPLAHDRCPRIPRVLHTDGGTSPEDNKKGSKILRVKSLKMKHKDESMEDLSVNPAERQTKIKERLKKFFHRRPTMESLVKKGIWKDEPVFGCYLEQVCGPEFPRVPLFVQRCIQCIERNVENMKTDGLYRASGNLSQVQKIRLQVDQNNYSVLEQEEDVHVLTSALKLFFRELKQPLIPFHLFSKALKASTNHNRKEKLKEFREIVKALPTPNHDTLKYLLQHLLQVTKYQGDKESNRMHIPNLAIVFGPTLMWPEQESLNMAFDMMQQNLVIECFLAEFDYIFR